jgi:predicted Zn-dependent protease
MRARRFSGRARAILSAALLGLGLGLAGCVGAGSGLIVASAPAPVAVPVLAERPADRDHARLVSAFGGEYRAPQAHALVTEIAGRLAKASTRPEEAYQVTLLDSPVVNAFALPTGRLYVTRGLLALANDTAELAAVLAHEIAHVTLRHADARTELEARSVLVSRVVADVLNDPVAGALVRDRSRFSLASFSRAQELEADQAGIKTLAKAGYDPYGAVRFLHALGRSSALRAGAEASTTPDILSTHPSTPERVALGVQSARRIGAPGLGEGDRARYLAAIDGLAYGDNPADGIIRGRRFIHARLGVAFEAPEGLALENTAQAVLGSSADGSRRLLFDAVEAAADSSLAELLRSTWRDAITDEIETLTINNWPVAIAGSQGKEWVFRMAAIRVGATTYRLILAARAPGSGLEAAFRAALASVRQVTPEEGAAIRPLRIQLVSAAEGDSVEKLAGTMVVGDRPAERFLVLNGLERIRAVKAGERYKVIVE